MFYLVLGEPYRMKEEGQIAFLKFSKVALDISDVSSKSIAKLIQECTLDDPEMRPNFSQLTIELRKKFANYEKLASNSKQRKRFEKERNECKRIYQNLLPSVSLETIQTSIEISDEEENLNQNSSKHSSFSQNSQENRYENNNFEEDDEENRDYQEILDTNSNPRLEKKRFRQLTTTLASKFQRLFRQ
ncbi:unnamed protein product [Caenorhabditis angaria]|uniref:Protein kinase domain-containing protein n=1 Tax=Caenorhabditis angaria TaxID=860376 RepID=A0A9P1IB32_9PELO|nr:unnamed protein product [Caenorhabditis angaria]